MSYKIDYEVNEYDLYAAKAQMLNELGLAEEATLFESLADLCYEKAAMLTRLEQLYDSHRRRMSPKSGSGPTK